jgi:oxalate decarboxylase/phosphoglucose isomerase-like protein (cupin superfamily)
MGKTDLTEFERNLLNGLVDPILEPVVYHFGSDQHHVKQYDKRENMYAGEGTVYLMQMFEEDELVNNRIGAYMILPSSADSCGFHTHGTRHEQEIYLVMHGEGVYLEKDEWEGAERSYPLSKGNLTTVRGDAFHAVKNTGDEPLIIFVITTNEPES